MKNKKSIRNSLSFIFFLLFYLLLCFLYSSTEYHSVSTNIYLFVCHFTTSDFVCHFFSISVSDISINDNSIAKSYQNELPTQFTAQSQVFHSDTTPVYNFSFYFIYRM